MNVESSFHRDRLDHARTLVVASSASATVQRKSGFRRIDASYKSGVAAPGDAGVARQTIVLKIIGIVARTAGIDGCECGADGRARGGTHIEPKACARLDRDERAVLRLHCEVASNPKRRI